MRFSTQLVVLAAMLLLPFLTYAQCTVDIDQGNTLHINCGDDVMLTTSNGLGTFIGDNFNVGSADTNLWQQVIGAEFSNPCGPNLLSNSTYLWMGASSGTPRAVTTYPLDLTCGGTICFDFKMGEQGTAAPCEGPDQASDGIYLEFSDTGFWWFPWYFFNPDTVCCGCPSTGCGGMSPSPFVSWDNYCFTIPPAAQTPNTRIRIIQKNSSTANFDHWGIDEFEINSGCQGVSVLWSTNDTIDTTYLSGITADTTVWLLKTNGIDTCTDTIHIIVDSLQFNPLASFDTVCPGATVQLDMNTANAIGINNQISYNYQWSPALGLTNPAQTVTDATPSASTTYTASIAHPNYPVCSASEDVTVTVDGATVSFNSWQVTDEHCAATTPVSDGSISIFASGGSGNYLYDIGTGQGPNSVWTGLSAQLYPVMVIDSAVNCTINVNLTVGSDPGPVIDSLSSTAILCNGDCNAIAQVFSSGSTGTTSYTWTGQQGGTASGSQVSGLCADTWTVEIQDDFCTVQNTVTITEPTTLIVSETANQNTSCSDVADGFVAVNATQGTPPYTYFWPTLGLSTPGTGLQLPGTYDCIVTDQNGCTATITSIIGFDHIPPTVDLGPDVSTCAGDTVVLSGPAGMASYQWQDGTSSANYGATQPGQYILLVTDPNGCTATDSLTLSHHFPIPKPNLGNDTVVIGDSLVLDAGFGYHSYTWISPTVTIGQTITVTSSGSYIIQVTDAWDCLAFDTINVFIYPTGIENSGVLSTAQLFPNPTTGIVEATLPGLAGKAVSITLTNALGQTVLQQNTTPNSSERIMLDLTEREKGVYFLQVLHEQEDRTFRLVLK